MPGLRTRVGSGRSMGDEEVDRIKPKPKPDGDEGKRERGKRGGGRDNTPYSQLLQQEDERQ